MSACCHPFQVVACVEELAATAGNAVLVFSGSECAKLEETFEGLPVWLAAENGVYLRPPWNRPDLPQVRGNYGIFTAGC